MSPTRRRFLSFTARAGALATAGAQGLRLRAQQGLPPAPPGIHDLDPRIGSQGVEKLFKYCDRRSKVALIQGDSRRKNIYEALLAIDEQIRPVLQTRKSVIIKPNGVIPQRQLAVTHVDAIHGVLDYLAPRFKGPVVIAECSGNTRQVIENFNWNQAVTEHKPEDIRLVVLNEEPRYELMYGIDYDLHTIPIRLAARLLDPNAYVFSLPVMKNHNMVVATLAVKNMVIGTPLQSAAKETPRWNDKRKFHVGIRQANFNMMLAAQRMIPYWGAAVIDGFEGMEGDGPSNGTPVDHRIAIASTDYIAADRVGLECMGIDPSWLAYLNYCYQVGLGQYDLSMIDVVGAKIVDVRKQYRHHIDLERMLKWRDQMPDLVPNLGRQFQPAPGTEPQVAG
jgi:uncharacterized protein (DUF362 family)